MHGLGKTMRDAGGFLPPALLRPFGRPTAVFFHGVEHKLDDPRVQSNHHDFADFSDIAANLKHNFDVMPLAEMARVLRNPARHRRAIFLMCDDGYANNLTVASDILEQFALPWSLFVSTWHIDTAARSPVFIARLFCLFARQEKYEIPNLSGTIDLNRDRARESDRVIAALRALDATRADEAVAAMQAAIEPALLASLLERFRSDSFLDWPQVKILKEKGVEIGAHAHVHWPMHGAQPPSYLVEQARLARARVEAEIGPCRYFAYPFGNTGDVCRAAWQAVRDAGYDYAFTTLSGSLDASRNPYLMPRYGLQMREPKLASTVPILRMGNGRLRNWQRQLS